MVESQTSSLRGRTPALARFVARVSDRRSVAAQGLKTLVARLVAQFTTQFSLSPVGRSFADDSRKQLRKWNDTHRPQQAMPWLAGCAPLMTLFARVA